MKIIYILWWCNGEEYEDKVENVVGIFSSKDLSERYLARRILVMGVQSRREKYTICEMQLDPDPDPETEKPIVSKALWRRLLQKKVRVGK